MWVGGFKNGEKHAYVIKVWPLKYNGYTMLWKTFLTLCPSVKLGKERYLLAYIVDSVR